MISVKLISALTIFVVSFPTIAFAGPTRHLQKTPNVTLEKGIKDRGVKGCGKCGLAGGKVAKPKPRVCEPKSDSIDCYLKRNSN